MFENIHTSESPKSNTHTNCMISDTPRQKDDISNTEQIRSRLSKNINHRNLDLEQRRVDVNSLKRPNEYLRNKCNIRRSKDETNVIRIERDNQFYHTLLLYDDSSRFKYAKVFVCNFKSCNFRSCKKSTIDNHVNKVDHLNVKDFRC